MSKHDAEELDFVERFLRCEGLNYRPVKQRPGNAPDFLLHGPGDVLGLEVTRVHRDTEPDSLPRRQVEGLRDSILRGAKRAWDGRGLPAVEVHCHFNPRSTPTQAEVHSTVGQLVETVSRNLPGFSTWVKLDSLEESDAHLAHFVHAVTIYRNEAMEESFWASPDAEWGADLTVELVAARIDAKNAKLAGYRRTALSNWLLIVMDSRRFSGMMRVPSTVLEHRFETDFDGTFLLDVLSMQCWPLRTVR